MTRPKTQGIFSFHRSSTPRRECCSRGTQDRSRNSGCWTVRNNADTTAPARRQYGCIPAFPTPHLLAVEVGGFRRYTIRQHPKSMIDTAIEKFLQPIEFRFKFQAVHSLYDLIRL